MEKWVSKLVVYGYEESEEEKGLVVKLWMYVIYL